jgi:hypothetical protein
MQPHQRLIAVPQTWVRNDELGRPGWSEILLQRLRHHYEIALNEPRFVAFIPFIWSFDVGAGVETPGLGLNRVPEWFDDGADDPGTALVDAVLDIGRQIKTRDYHYPNLHWSQTEAHPARPASQVIGEITSVSDDGWVEAWALDRGLPHKNLRVRVSVGNLWGQEYANSGFFRTDLPADDLARDPRVDQPLVGQHGLRFRIPPAALKALQNRQSWPSYVWLEVYADGDDEQPVLNIRQRYGSKAFFKGLMSRLGRASR